MPLRLSLLPAYPLRTEVCRYLSHVLGAHTWSALCPTLRRQLHAVIREDHAPLPQGSSLESGLFCPSPSSLIDPIRPTRGHIRISPVTGLYGMPSLCGSA